MAGFIGLVLFDIVDIYWIGLIGKRAVAGVASAGFIVWVLYALVQITGAGCASMVANFYGAKKKRRAWEVVIQSTWLSLFISIFICISLMVKLSKPFELMGLDIKTMEMAIGYFKIILIGFPAIYLDILAGNIFNAYGDTKLSNAIMILCLFFNIVLDPILMFGWFSMPALGVNGAAIATISCHILSFILRAIFLRKKNYIPPLIRFIRIRTFYYWKIIAIGLPNAMAACVWSIVYPVLTRLITPFGVAPLSALGICHRLESFPYFSSVAFGIAMTSLVGQAHGKKDPEEVKKIVTAGIRSLSLLMLPFMYTYMFHSKQLLSLMTTDRQIIAYGTEYLFIVGVFELFLGWEMVFAGIFTGLGITHPTLLITLPLTIGRIPLAWLLAYHFNWGISGIWWAISISTLAKGVGLSLLYLYAEKNWLVYKTK